jgi:hypothetical protein
MLRKCNLLSTNLFKTPELHGGPDHKKCFHHLPTSWNLEVRTEKARRVGVVPSVLRNKKVTFTIHDLANIWSQITLDFVNTTIIVFTFC